MFQQRQELSLEPSSEKFARDTSNCWAARFSPICPFRTASTACSIFSWFQDFLILFLVYLRTILCYSLLTKNRSGVHVSGSNKSHSLRGKVDPKGSFCPVQHRVIYCNITSAQGNTFNKLQQTLKGRYLLNTLDTLV